MAERFEVVGGLGAGLAVLGDNHLRARVERNGGDAHVANADLAQRRGQLLVLGYARDQDHAVQLLLQREAAHAVDVILLRAVAGMHDQLVTGVA